MNHFLHSEPGHAHGNEDAVSVLVYASDASVLLCALADGQGGQAGGGIAARLAVEKSLEMASEYALDSLLMATAWYEILSYADETVCDSSDAGFTTLVALCASPTLICGASCGDSAAYLIGGSSFKALTDNQRKDPPAGSSAAQPVAFQARPEAGDKLLIMSDGVWRYLGKEVIAGAARELPGGEIAPALRRMQTDRTGGRLADDFSLIVVEF